MLPFLSKSCSALNEAETHMQNKWVKDHVLRQKWHYQATCAFHNHEGFVMLWYFHDKLHCHAVTEDTCTSLRMAQWRKTTKLLKNFKRSWEFSRNITSPQYCCPTYKPSPQYLPSIKALKSVHFYIAFTYNTVKEN